MRALRVPALLLAAGLGACTTAYVAPEPDTRPGPSTAATLGIPPGHLPRSGQCRIWIPGTPPGRQPFRRSRACSGIRRDAPAGSWIVYRPTRDRKLVHVRVVDERRVGVILVVRIYDIDSGRFLKEERPTEADEEPEEEAR